MNRLRNAVALAILCGLLCLMIRDTAGASTRISTDRATVTITPIVRDPMAVAAWHAVYDYEGGNLPPGTDIYTYGKSADPTVRTASDGAHIAFPAVSTGVIQPMKWSYSIDRPLANWRTRLTIRYTQVFDKGTAATPIGPWAHMALSLYPSRRDGIILGGSGAPQGLNETGDNTIAVEFDATHMYSLTVNGQAADLKFAPKPLDRQGALIGNEIGFSNDLMQFPNDSGDIIVIHGVTIEQMRPDSAVSAAAAVDLTVPGPDPARVSLEAVDSKNVSVSEVLRDAVVAPGTYRLYWDGIESPSKSPDLSTPLPAGPYTFRLTTSAVKLEHIGDIDNSTPPGQPRSYGLVAISAMALMPDSSPPRTGLYYSQDWYFSQGYVNPNPTPVHDSVLMEGVSYDMSEANWVGANGESISTKADGVDGQRCRSVAVAPADPNAPNDPSHQLIYVSQSIGSVFGVAAIYRPTEGAYTNGKRKVMSGPDWNHPDGDYAPYHILIGRIPGMIGQKHYLAIQLPDDGEFALRNVRIYEAGSAAPSPLTFDASRFTKRIWLPVRSGTPTDVPAGAIDITDNGAGVDFRTGMLNYPLDYVVTKNTVLDFDFKVVKPGNIGRGGGIGLDDDQNRWYAYNLDDPQMDEVVNLLSLDPMGGIIAPELGVHVYPKYIPGTLYPTHTPNPPVSSPEEAYEESRDYRLLWDPGYYGLKISADGSLLFACNNADGQVEVRDVAGDGSLVAKLPIDYPMFLDWAPIGIGGAPAGSRWVYITSPHAGLVRVAWNDVTHTFGAPKVLVPASEFAYPRGIAYDSVNNRLFVCDAYTPDRSKVANQIDVIDPATGTFLTRYGKPGGTDPFLGGPIADDIFTCPLTVVADSTGAVWVNDYYTGQALKFDVNPVTQQFTVLHRVFGPDYTNISHFYFLPGGTPNEAWGVTANYIRYAADIGAHGKYVNQHVTGVVRSELANNLRPYIHMTEVNGRNYFIAWQPRALYPRYDSNGRLTTINEAFDPPDWTQAIFELSGTSLMRRAVFGQRAVIAARLAGLSNDGIGPPTALDAAAASSGDPKWRQRLWVWSDLNGDGKMAYSADNPEFKIAFNTDILTPLWGDLAPTTSLREGDGAYIVPTNAGVFALAPKTVNGQLSWDWNNKTLLVPGNFMKMSPRPIDYLADMQHTYILFNDGKRIEWSPSDLKYISAYAPDGTLLWTRLRDVDSPLQMLACGPGLISVVPWNGQVETYGPIEMLTSDGDSVVRIPKDEPADSWGPTVLRADADTAYVGWGNVTKVTGLSTIKSSAGEADMPAGFSPPIPVQQ